ncbi:hypothetical protein OG453_31725 [Streptomyces sp. NBC_01381]|uniref:hypothetical protein n=1 Tax=Streptomyces sp. NBC_01381 TaxID=2903845 RepID=UPI002254A59D|nr:hypothetical protein [Streptomyces sp. NBC_01381]MCX4671198.1 hypothetical protein [Streptomyces sp. NBC_01381]
MQDPFSLEDIVQYAFEGGAPLLWVQFVEEVSEPASKRFEFRTPPSQALRLGAACRKPCCPFVVTCLVHPGERIFDVHQTSHARLQPLSR